MNYRHAFHAGNFADVHKHVILLALLEHLRKKPAAFFVLDTHAGRGAYDLNSAEAQRSGEWRDGVERVRKAASASPLVQRYLDLASTARRYLGSPLLIAAMLRETDRAVFVERQPEEAEALRISLGKRRHISISNDDGYAALKAQLPPKENRGLVLIDPPYETVTEFEDVGRELLQALHRWPNGIYCVWYPIKQAVAKLGLQRTLIAAGIKKILILELTIKPHDSPLGLNGSGLLIINPPWQFDERIVPIQQELHSAMSLDRSSYVRAEWLAGE